MHQSIRRHFAGAPSAVTLSTADLARFVEIFADRLHDAKDELTELDSAIGDADHGINMDRGFSAVREVLPRLSEGEPGPLFKEVGMKLISTVGGASGPLYGTFFLRLGTALGDAHQVDATLLASGLRAGLGGVIARGKAELDDKTMVDAMTPAVAAIEAGAANGLATALGAAASGRGSTVATGSRLSSRARGARAISVNARRATRTLGPRARPSCSSPFATP